MGYQVTGAEGVVTSWTGTFYANLLSKMRAMEASVTATCETKEVTALGDYGRRILPGLSSWKASLSGVPLTTASNAGPQVGNVGNVVFTNSTNIFIDSYSLNLTADVIDTTALNATAPLWRTFRPGAVRWSGTLNARMDSSNPFPLPAAIAEAALSTVFTYGTTATATGLIHVTNVAPAIRVGSLTLVPISFEGTSDLAFGGTNGIFGANTFGRTAGTGAMSTDIPEWNSTGSSAKPLVINLSRDGTAVLTGADSFWSSIGLTVNVAEVTRVAIGVQGSGAVTCT